MDTYDKRGIQYYKNVRLLDIRNSNMRLKTWNVLLVLTEVGTECQFYLLVVPYTQLLKAMQKDYYTNYCNISKLKTDNKYRLIINKTKIRLG